jgi:hypothetical protein
MTKRPIASARRFRCSRRRRGGLGPPESRGRANDRPWTLLHVSLLTSSTSRNPLRRLRESGMSVMQLKDGSATYRDLSLEVARTARRISRLASSTGRHCLHGDIAPAIGFVNPSASVCGDAWTPSLDRLLNIRSDRLATHNSVSVRCSQTELSQAPWFVRWLR